LLNSNGEVESPAAFGNFGSVSKAEVENLDLAVKFGRSSETISRGSLVCDSARVLPEEGSTINKGSLSLDRDIEARGRQSNLKVRF